MIKLYRDYETRSAVDLEKAGAVKYAQHPSTEVYCLAIKFVDDDDPDYVEDMSCIWVNPKYRHHLPIQHGLPLIDTDKLTDLYVRQNPSESHNDPFEQAIDKYIMEERYGVPATPLPLRSCSAAQASVNALPRDLGTLTEALGLSAKGMGKDKEGHALMLKMCKPAQMSRKKWKILDEKFDKSYLYHEAREVYKNASGNKGKAYSTFIADNWGYLLKNGVDPEEFITWHIDEHPEDLKRLCRYCLKDVDAEYAAGRVMPKMSPGDQRMWQLDQVINNRGVRIDVQGAKDAIAMVNTYKAHRSQKLPELTEGLITTANQLEAMRAWCRGKGVSLPNMAKDTLEAELRDNKNLPAEVREVLNIRVACGQTSTTKYEAMIRAASDDDHRIRGVFIFGGAMTGRWTARLVQLHNMPRGKIKLKTDADIEAAYQAMACGWEEVELLYGDPMELAASAVRGCIVSAPGKEFVVSDFSSVEARKILWLAGDEEGLQVYREGRDAYKVAAADVFGGLAEEITDDQRNVGKVGVLSLGFGGGIGAYASMARNYNIDLETLVPLILKNASGHERKKAEATARTYLDNLEERIKDKIENNKGDASPLDRMSLEAAMSCDIIKQRWRNARPKVLDFWRDLETAAFRAIQNPSKTYKVGKHITFGRSGRHLLMRLPSGRCIKYYRPSIKRVKKFGKMGNTIVYWRVTNGQWKPTTTYGGKLCENATQASSNCLLRHAMVNVEKSSIPVVLHVHDEAASEVPEGSVTQGYYDKLMIKLPAWAEGLPMEAEGWTGRRYRKS